MILLFCVSNAHAEDQKAATQDIPVNGYVPDERTAIQIAEAVWIPIYGAAKIKGEEPFDAELQGDVWIVEGSLPKMPGYIVKGGTAMAKISQKDGRIIDVWHEK
jgi:hypothetical protein